MGGKSKRLPTIGYPLGPGGRGGRERNLAERMSAAHPRMAEARKRYGWSFTMSRKGATVSIYSRTGGVAEDGKGDGRNHTVATRTKSSPIFPGSFIPSRRAIDWEIPLLRLGDLNIDANVLIWTFGLHGGSGWVPKVCGALLFGSRRMAGCVGERDKQAFLD